MLFEKISNLKSHFEQQVILNGYSTAIVNAMKGVIYRCFGFKWEKCYLMSCELNEAYAPRVRKDIEVREICLSDYDNELWSGFLTKEKRSIYEARFKNKNAKAYGAFIGETLAYSTWILYGKVIYSETEIILEQDDCALLLDTYCQPQFRGSGLHNYTNQWCLFMMKEYGMKKAFVIVLSGNRSAIKTQKRCGLEVEKTFYAWRLGKRKYINIPG